MGGSCDGGAHVSFSSWRHFCLKLISHGQVLSLLLVVASCSSFRLDFQGSVFFFLYLGLWLKLGLCILIVGDGYILIVFVLPR